MPNIFDPFSHFTRKHFRVLDCLLDKRFEDVTLGLGDYDENLS